ncbi:hypothetical protein NC651_023320 [Populus alba x Populus x berolinensis]|nr:hypothetical protein NC651_023320 [Populus alba x Populus x berolinensis]
MNSTHWSFLALLVLIQSLSHEFSLSLSQFPLCLYDWGFRGEQKAQQILNGPLLLYCTNVSSPGSF